MSIFTPGPKSAVDDAYEWLREEVVQLPWDQEGYLSENELAKNSKFSRTPIREALLRLEAEGLVRRVPHRGVITPALRQENIEALMEVREVIEVWSVQKAIRTAMTTTGLWDLIEQQESTINDPTTFIRLDIEFHSRIVKHGNNEVFTNLYQAHRYKQLRLGIKAIGHEGRINEVIREHSAIIEAIDSKDVSAAEESVLYHLKATKNFIDS